MWHFGPSRSSHSLSSGQRRGRAPEAPARWHGRAQGDEGVMSGRVTAAELARVRILTALGEGSLERLAAVAFTRRLAANQILFVGGEPSDHLYVVRSGLLRV